MNPQDPFVPMPMPDAPWAERVTILVAAHVADGVTVPWSHGEDALWLDELENTGLASVLGEVLAERALGVVVSARPLAPHYVVVMDGPKADELLACALRVLERFRGPVTRGSKAVLTRSMEGHAGMRVEMVELA